LNIFSVIVCYKPDIKQLFQLCKKLIDDGSKVVLVDNTEEPYLKNKTLLDGCQLITFGSNTGIAKAQNAGIDLAIQEGGDVIAFFDQDSLVENGVLKALTAELDTDKADIVSPRCLDNLNKLELPALKVSRYGLAKPVYNNQSDSPYMVDVIISSGTVASKEVFQRAGNFDERLFIDYVDTEWCLRCRSKGIPVRVVPSAIMHHRIGTNTTKIGPLTVQIHSADRCYYQIRNSFHLFRRRHIPFIFALKEVISTIVNRVLLLFLVENRVLYAKAYLRAIMDGLLGVVGPKTT